MRRIVYVCLSALVCTMHSFSFHPIYTKFYTGARMYFADVFYIKSPRLLDTCGCGEANSNFVLAKTGTNFKGT
jgi:hypothetical protein